MQRLLAIAKVTVKAAFRFRLVLVLGALLLGSVIVLPIIIKDDGTARGFTQILVTYTLSAITALLGLATFWMACGTLARDVEESQIQMVAVKPIARWQIWVGKWMGVMMVNALLLAVSGSAVYFLLQWRATKLSPAQQKVLREEVLVARGSVRPPDPTARIEVETDRLTRERTEKMNLSPADLQQVRDQIRERLKQEHQLVPPGYLRRWKLDLGLKKESLGDNPLFLRVKFSVAQKSPSETYLTVWEIGVPETSRLWRKQISVAADSFHEFQVPPNLFDEQGVLTVDVLNPNETALVFLVEDGLELLYPEGSFALNFFRGLSIIFLWLGLFAAIGLAASSFLSFPVAAFLSMTVLLVGLSTGTLSQVVEEGGIMGVNHETGYIDNPTIFDNFVVAVFKGVLAVIKLVLDFSPIDQLSTGRSISWSELGRAFGQILVFMAGATALIGISIFNRRELAKAQTQQ